MRVRKSAIAGVLLLLIAVLAVPVAAAEEYVFVAKWGSYGTGDGQFDQPWGVAVDSADNVYVAELINDRIQKFDSSGNFLTMWGSSGTNDGQFQRPQAVTVDTAGNVYVTDDGNSRVQKFDDSGRFITAWGSKGSDDGNFSWPAGIAVNAVGNIYVADAGNNRIQKFTGSAFLIKWGSYGTGDGQFDRPWGVAVDSADNVYVIDNWNHRIQKFDADGTFLTTLGSLGANEGQFLYPQGVTVDRAGNVYVADTSNYRIQKFDADGTFLTMWGSSGYSDGQFWSPWSVAVDSAGNVYVADRGNNRIQKFAPIPIPTITGIAPNSSTNNGPVNITDLSGTGFIDGATVKLTQAGEPEIVATNVSVVSSTQITCTLDLTGAAARSWNVVVANPGGQPVTLADGFIVTAGNQAPVAANDTYTADEGVMLSVDAPGVLANDNDPDSDPLTAVLVDDVSNGTLNLNADGLFTYMPDTGFSGIDTFTYTANDGSQSSNVATVSIVVNPASAVLTSIVVTPAQPILEIGGTQQFTATGYDQYGDPIPTGEIVWSSTNDTVGTIDASGLFTALAAGSTELIAEANGTSGKANVTVTPASQVLTSIAVTPESPALEIGTAQQFTATCYDQYGQKMPDVTVSWSSDNTTVGTIDATGFFTATAEGSTTVTATAAEISGTAEVTVTPALTVTGIAPNSSTNTGPVSITDLSGTGFVDGATVKLTRAGEPEIVATNVSVASSTQITCTLDLTGAAVGPWNVMVTNPGNQSATLTDRFTVNAGNRAPNAEDDTYTTDEDKLLTVTAPGVLENDNDLDGDTLTVTLVASTTNGTLALNPDGSFAYTPNPGWSGNDTFTYAANDSILASNTATVTITVNPMNKPPNAHDDAYGVNEGEILTVAAPGVLENDNDPDGDALAAVLATESSHGSVTLGTDGSFTYTPDSGFSGTDTFTYRASDGDLDSKVATVTITVTPVNEVPAAVDDTYATDEAVALSVNAPGVLGNDDDPDGDTLTAVLVDGASHGTLTLNPDGSFVYTPDANFAGTDSFTYRASDGELESATATVTITVTAVNHPPVAADDACTLEQDTTHTEPAPGVLANDDDLDGDGLTAVLENSVSHGSLTLNTDGSFTYMPNAGWSGTDSFTYKAFDGELYSGAAAVTITVTEAANNLPEVTAVTAPTDPRLPGSVVSVTGTFTDPDADDTHTATWNWGDGATSEGTVDKATGTVTGSYTYTAPGTYTITLTVTDSKGASDTRTTSITVQTPAEATTDLISQVESLSLPGGIESGLTSKLDNAITALNSENEKAAVNNLNALINQVKAQRGKKIPAGEADALIAMVQRIIESI